MRGVPYSPAAPAQTACIVISRPLSPDAQNLAQGPIFFEIAFDAIFQFGAISPLQRLFHIVMRLAHRRDASSSIFYDLGICASECRDFASTPSLIAASFGMAAALIHILRATSR